MSMAPLLPDVALVIMADEMVTLITFNRVVFEVLTWHSAGIPKSVTIHLNKYWSRKVTSLIANVLEVSELPVAMVCEKMGLSDKLNHPVPESYCHCTLKGPVPVHEVVLVMLVPLQTVWSTGWVVNCGLE